MATLQNVPFELSYAGIPFQVDEPTIDEWIGARLPQQYTQETAPVPGWAGRELQALAWPWHPSRPPIAINELYYPTGAARWTEFRGLATESAAQQMIEAVYSHTTGTQLAPFFMQMQVNGEAQDRDPNPGVSTNLYMLPPRPVLQTDNGRDGLYLITLVDERYYGFHSPATIQFDNGTTWTTYFNSLAVALGVTLTVPTLSLAYGFPSLDSSLWATGQNAAWLLDSAAWNVGCIVVRNFDGTYSLVPVSNVAYAATRPKFNIAGGAFADALDPQNLIPALEAVLPSAIVVTFPKYKTYGGYIDQTGTVAKPGRYIPRVNEPYLDVYTITTTIAHATATDVLGNPISNYHGIGTKTLKTAGKAYFTNFTDAVPLNNSDCQSLAAQLANDYWSYTALGMDEVYLGTRGWQPESGHDVLWTYRKDRPATRVMRLPWNYWPTDFQHELVPNSGNHDGPNAGPALELVLCNTSTPDGSGRYDSSLAVKIGIGETETATGGEAVWLHSPNGDTLTSGTFYLARLMQVENGRKLYDTDKQSSGSGSSPVWALFAVVDGQSISPQASSSLDLSFVTGVGGWAGGAGFGFVVPVTGYYVLGYDLTFTGLAGDEASGAEVRINFSGQQAGVVDQNTNTAGLSGNFALAASGLVQILTSNTITLNFHNLGLLDILGTVGASSTVWLTKVS